MLSSLLFDLAYLAAMVGLVPYLAYQTWTKGKYRGGWPEKLLGNLPLRTGDAPCVWLHAVSVGEINLLPTFLAPFKKRYPHWTVVITTTTVTGLAVAKKRFPNDIVCYCPLDFSWAVERALTRIRPNLLILAELELWPNLIRLAQKKGAKVAVINARLSDKSYAGYARLRWMLRPLFQKLDYVGAQSPEYVRRFADLGVRRSALFLTGSLKFDGAETERRNPRTERLKQLIHYGDTPLFLAGSTGGNEEKYVLTAFQCARKKEPALRLILAPRHLERIPEIKALLHSTGLNWALRSQLPLASKNSPPDVLVIDVIGELAHWWGLAHFGFVGGTLYPRGGQNMIEPAGYGVAVCHGTDYRNFRDVVALFQAAEAQRIVHSPAELTAFLLDCLSHPDLAQTLGRKAAGVVLRSQGATIRTLDTMALACGALLQASLTSETNRSSSGESGGALSAAA